MSLAADVARAALLEAGRADLAARVRPNARGWPSLTGGIRLLKPADKACVARAFLLGHHAGGHPDATEGPDSAGAHSLYCPLCSHGSWDAL